MDFATVFKLMCKENGTTQKQALSDMGLGRSAAQRWIDGWPSYETILKISEYFFVPVETLMRCMEAEDEAWVVSLFDQNKKTPTPEGEREAKHRRYIEALETADPVIQEAVLRLLKLQ